MKSDKSGRVGRPRDFEDEEVERITITLPKTIVKRLQYAALQKEKNRNVIIHEALTQYLSTDSV